MAASEKSSTYRDRILKVFKGDKAQEAIFLPNLSLWYDWHSSKETLPARWREFGIIDICNDIEVPVWITGKPWNLEWSIPVVENQSETGKSVEYQIGGRVLTAAWIVGPDGDWWQSEYPVKTEEDLNALGDAFRGMSYSVGADFGPRTREEIDGRGVVALELPMHPYSFLLQHFLGWTEGVMLAMMHPETVSGLCTQVEAKFRSLVSQISSFDVDLLYCPDNLDASFISPLVFESDMAASYQETSRIAHKSDKSVVVHAGGMIAPLIAPLAESGIDVIEGISGPPQSDATISQALDQSGNSVTLWGGIPQDALLPTSDRAEFESIVQTAATEAAQSGRAVVGVADRVPIGADIDRLEWLVNKLK